MKFNHFFGWRGFMAVAILLITIYSASANEQSKTVDGMTIYYGIVPAEIISKQPDKHDPTMHSRRWLPVGSHHLTVALFDDKTGQRIVDATVDTAVTPLGLATTRKRLEPMLINQTTSYGNFFDFPSGSGPFRIEFNIKRPKMPAPSVLEFEYKPAGRP